MRKDAVKILKKNKLIRAAEKTKAAEKAEKRGKGAILRKQRAAERKELTVIDNKKSLVQAKAIGLLGDTDNVNEIVKSLEKIEPLYNIDKANDRIDNKIFCIMLMEGMIREFRGDYIPNFRMAGRLVGRPHKYMLELWKDREEITAQKNTILDKGLDMVRVKLTINLLKMTNALDRMTVDKWESYFSNAKEMKNFMDFYDKLLLRTRLLGNLSTDNVEHHHKHSGKVDLVQTDEM